MNRLENAIRERIKKDGPITFDAFMEMALYYPGLGYYTSAETEIGRRGDFYTSPHLHPIFGSMLGRQAEEMWEIIGRPGEFHIVEAGPGRGWLARDVLDYLSGKDLYRRLVYTLVELNPLMRERQSELLKEHSQRVTWTSGIRNMSLTGIILSNELFDALPVHLVEINDELREIYISLEGDKLVETQGPPSSPALAAYFDEFGITPSRNFRTEINLRARDWLEDASAALREGFIVTIDYGYSAQELYSPDRDRGTLLCYYRHTVNEEPLERIGKQDMTSHVNFSALKRWGETLGLKSLGFARQGPYLVSLGIDEIIMELAESSTDYEKEISKIKGLIMSEGFGDTHKVMIQYRGRSDPALRGFTMSNRIASL